MARIAHLLKPYYQEGWNKSWVPYSPENVIAVRKYILKSIDVTASIDGAPYQAGPTVIKAVNILNTEKKSFFRKDSWVWIPFPEDFGPLPDYVTLRTDGALSFSRQEDLGFWKSLAQGAKSTLSSPAFRVWSAIVFPKMLGPGGELAWVGNALDWVTTKANKITDPWLDWVDRTLNQFTTWIEDYYFTVRQPFLVLKKSIEETIEPVVSSYRMVLQKYSTTFEKIVVSQRKIADIVEKPQLAYQHAVLAPFRITRGRIDHDLRAVADFLAMLGISEGIKARAWSKGIFDQIGEFITDPYTGYKRYVLKLDIYFQNFFDTVIEPIKIIVSEDHGVIKRVIEITGAADQEVYKLQRTPFQNTLGTYPATTVSILGRQLDGDRPEKPDVPEPIEKTLPEITWYSEAIDKADENLYIDSNDNIIAEGKAEDGSFTASPAKLKGEVVNLPEAFIQPKEDRVDEIIGMNYLWSKAVDEGRVLDGELAIDTPGELAWNILDLAALPTLVFGWFPYLETEYALKGAKFLLEESDENRIFLDAIWDEFLEDMRWLGGYLKKGGQPRPF